jgi:plasmid stabilization system protein ParE
MAKEVVLTDRAIVEYYKLFDYVFEEWGEEIAARVSLGLYQTLQNIQKHPEYYPVYIKRKKIRRCVASRQTSIFYKIEKDVIRILSFFDNRQSPHKLKL